MIRQVFKEFNPKAKTKDWFRRVLDELVVKKEYLIDRKRYEINRSFAEGKYDVSFARKKYETFNVKPEDLNIDFAPLDLFGTRRSAITSLIEKQGYEIRAVCTDPSASSKREQDIDLLKAEKKLEPVRKQLGRVIGMNTPLPVTKPEDFSSDVSPIKSMGLDISNPTDEAIFKDYLQRQKWETAIELGVTHYLNMAGFKETFKSWVEGLIDNNCYAGQVVTNSFSGEPTLIDLHPYEVYTILGKRVDRRDSLGKGWEKTVTVREIIALMGQDITVDDLDEILKAANGFSSTDFIGFWFDPLTPCPDKHCSWGAFLNMKCSLGYLELRSQDSDLYLHRNDNGAILTEQQTIDYDLPKGFNSVDSTDQLKSPNDRVLEYRFYDNTYKGFYLPFNRKVFGFGKLPLTTRFGSNNELTDFSIITYKLEGNSMNEKCQPFIKHVFDLWCKYQYFINESRPSGESWDIDVVREIAKEIVGITGDTNKVMEALKVLQNMTNTVHKKSTINDRPTGGDSDPVKPRIRGIDPTVDKIVSYMGYDLEQITEITGVSSIILAQQSPEGERGLGVSKLYLQQSINTIYYISYGIQCGFTNASFDLCQKIQWIANGSVTTEAYASLEKAIGERNVAALKELGTDPPYSFSIFFEFGINPVEQQRLEAMTDNLISVKAISPAQAMSISQIKNYKLAAALLGYYEARAQQQALQAQQQQVAATMQAEDQRHQNKMAEIDENGKWEDQVANTTGQWQYKTKMDALKLELEGKHSLQETKDLNKVAAGEVEHNQELQKMKAQNDMTANAEAA